jgi:ribonuclease R
VAASLGWTHGEGAPTVSDEVRALLSDCAACAAKLRARRMRRGALDLDLPEGRVRFGDDGVTPVDVVQSRADPGLRRAYQLVEELMLLANEVVAQACVAADVPTIFRVHGAPDEEALARFAAVAQAYGHKADIELGRSPRKLSALLRRVQGEPEGRVLAMLLLRALPQARYATTNTGHFGLASEAYLHFTSPIRRYPDLVVHRVVRALVRGEAIPRDDAARDAMTRAAAESSRLERRAMEVEREVLDLHRCVVAREHLGEVRSATVTGITAAGPYLDVESPFLSGLLRVDGVAAEAWELDELGIRARVPGTGLRYMLGEVKLVTLAEVSVQRRAVTFKPAEPLDDKSLRKVARKAEARIRGRRTK